MQVAVLFNGEKFSELYSKQFGLKQMYQYIECDSVDVVSVDNGIDVWVDDEGLLKSGNKVFSLTVGDEKRELAGNMLFLSHDEEGNTVGLNAQQRKHLADHMRVQLIGTTR